MKRKLIKMAFVIAIAVLGGINVFNAQKSGTLSDVALANVEALADNEMDSDMCSTFSGYAHSEKRIGKFQEYFHLQDGKDRLVTYNVNGCIAYGKGTLMGTPDVSIREYVRTDIVTCSGMCYYFQ